MLWLMILGCDAEPPAKAPSELEELCSFIFSRMADEETEELSKGLENLYDWIHADDNLYQSTEGYQIESLNGEDIKKLDEKDRSFRGELVGVATAYRYNYDQISVMEPAIVEHWPDIVGGYELYERTPTKDPACMLDQSCDWVEYDVHMKTNFVNLIDVDSYYNGQLRWVDSKYGPMALQRTWLDEPAVVTPDNFGIQIHEQYFFSTIMPTNCAGAIRITSIWIDTEWGVIPVTEDWAKDQVVQEMISHDGSIEDWLRENK